jgi:hypothetical protein
MGISPFSCDPHGKDGSKGNRTDPNPDPRNFKIVWIYDIGIYCMVKVHYPNCTSYGGDKIAVYRASKEELKNAKELDPHFLEGPGLYPIARFPANEQGAVNAKLLIEAMYGWS